MNHQSKYTQYATQTLDWLPMDTEDLYKSNLKNRYNDLEFHGWINNPFTYKFNSNGFRCGEFTQNPSILFLGCSFTLGVGVPVEQTWPELVSQQLSMQCANLGQGGSSADTAFRLCQGWIDKIHPKILVFARPPGGRIELIVNGWAQDLSPAWLEWSWCNYYSNYLKDWGTDDDNTNLNQLKNKLAIRMLCQDRGIKYIEIDPHALASKINILQLTLGRDLTHPGIGYHKRVSEIVLQLISS